MNTYMGRLKAAYVSNDKLLIFLRTRQEQISAVSEDYQLTFRLVLLTKYSMDVIYSIFTQKTLLQF